jgi:histidinol-phosphate aminotransferase
MLNKKEEVMNTTTFDRFTKGVTAVTRQLPPSLREEIRRMVRDIQFNLPSADNNGPLREAIAKIHQVPIDRVLIFRSPRDLMKDLRLSLVEGEVLMPWTEGGAREAFQDLGFNVTQIPWIKDPEGELSLDIQGFLDRWSSLRPKVVYLDLPNDPTGVALGEERVSELTGFTGGSLWVVDQRYADFSPQVPSPSDLLPLAGRGGMVVLRSFSLSWGMGALDGAYAIISSEELGRLFPSANSMEQPRGEILRYMVDQCGGWMESRTYSCRYLADEFRRGAEAIQGLRAYRGEGPFVLLESQRLGVVEALSGAGEWVFKVELPGTWGELVQVFASSEDRLASTLEELRTILENESAGEGELFTA